MSGIRPVSSMSRDQYQVSFGTNKDPKYIVQRFMSRTMFRIVRKNPTSQGVILKKILTNITMLTRELTVASAHQ